MHIAPVAENDLATSRQPQRNRKRKAAFFTDGAAFLTDPHSVFDWVYGAGRRQRLETIAEVHPVIVTSGNFAGFASEMREVEVIFSTWGMPQLTPAHLEGMPNLRALFFAGGSVAGFARPLLERGIKVVSAWGANAIPVAEFTLAQILLSNKGYFCNVRRYRDLDASERYYYGKGNYGEAVSLLGAGQIGRKVIEMLRPFALNVLVFDPYLSEAKAAALGATKVSLEEAFAKGLCVSNHLANVPGTVGLLNEPLFRSMREGATFINTGRGVTVAEPELIRVLQERPDLTALLDVTAPEPPVAGSPLYTLPNVKLSAHMAGSRGDEVVRMADFMIEEFKAWEEGRSLRFEVTLPMLATLA